MRYAVTVKFEMEGGPGRRVEIAQRVQDALALLPVAGAEVGVVLVHAPEITVEQKKEGA